MSLVVGTNSYVSVADADTYLDESVRAQESWPFVDERDKERALVSAARQLERVRWAGTKAVDTRAMEWPRSGVTDKYGDELADDAVPQVVKDAQVELALEISLASDLETQTSTADNTKRVKAGEAEIEFFKPTSGARFPAVVQELLVGLMAAGSSLGYPYASGVDYESGLEDYSVSE